MRHSRFARGARSACQRAASRFSFLVFIALLLGVGATTTAPVPGWTSLPNGPGFRTRFGMAADVRRETVVVFGGLVGGGGLSRDTWEWNGQAQTWTKRTTLGPQPTPRRDMAMAYDANRNRMVMHGGSDATGERNDTWEWKGSTGQWTKVHTPGPGDRSGHAMAYDPVRGRVIMFGGVNGQQPLAPTTWEWSGTAWQPIAFVGPSPRYAHVMATDTARNRIVLFGGLKRVPTDSGFEWEARRDTWEWDGNAWTQISHSGPSKRAFTAMAFDPVNEQTVLFGGQADSVLGPLSMSDTWLWDGSSWSESMVDGPPSRGFHGMAFDARRGEVLTYGGFQSNCFWCWPSTASWWRDTWAFAMDE